MGTCSQNCQCHQMFSDRNTDLQYATSQHGSVSEGSPAHANPHPTHMGSNITPAAWWLHFKTPSHSSQVSLVQVCRRNSPSSAPDAGLAGVAEDHPAIPKGLDRLEIGANRNFMTFRKEKCKVLHLGSNNPVHQWMLGAIQMERAGDPGGYQAEYWPECALAEKDFILGCITESAGSRSREKIPVLYTAVVRMQLESCIQFWNPSKGQRDVLESPTKGHKMMKGLDHLSYDEKMGETCPVTGQEAMGTDWNISLLLSK